VLVLDSCPLQLFVVVSLVRLVVSVGREVAIACLGHSLAHFGPVEVAFDNA